MVVVVVAVVEVEDETSAGAAVFVDSSGLELSAVMEAGS